MFTKPNAEYQTTSFNGDGTVVTSWGPVPVNLWNMFSTEKQASEILEKVKADVTADAALFDGLGLDIFIPVRYLDATTKIWVVKGSVTQGGDDLGIDEYCGSLSDRQIKRNPFVDRPGPDLIATRISSDLAQLSWGTK